MQTAIDADEARADMPLMHGKTVLVTGATGGVGKATAVGLARMGARVGITGRDIARAQAAAADIRAASSNGAVDAFAADLSSQTEVGRLAREVLDLITLAARKPALLQCATLSGFWGMKMRRRTVAAVALVLAIMVAGAAPISTVSADTIDKCARGATPHYVFGFADLSARLGDSMGTPITCEFPDPKGTGDVHQQARRGLAFWRKSTNTPTFTNGSEHWALTNRGLVYWTGSSIDPPASAAVVGSGPSTLIGPATSEQAPPPPRLLLDGQAPITCSPGTFLPQFTYCVYPDDSVGEWQENTGSWTFEGYYQNSVWHYTPAGQAAHPELSASQPPPQTQAPAISGSLTLGDLDGKATLVGDDGKYIGKLSSNQFDSESICNEFGVYGSQFSSTSIRNQFSNYGSQFSGLGAYNEFTSTPPAIIYSGRRVGYLTKNRFLSSAIDPDRALAAYGCSRFS